MARIVRTTTAPKPSSTLLGRTKLQATSITGLHRPTFPRPPAVPRPEKPPFAGIK